MFHVLLASHGDFAAALLKSAEMIVGEQGNYVLAIGIAAGESTEMLKKQIEQFVSSSASLGGTLILTDILSGSPFLTSVQAFRDLHEKVAIEIVTGANLPMLIEVLNARGYCTLAEAKQIALSEGAGGIRDFTAELQAMTSRTQ